MKLRFDTQVTTLGGQRQDLLGYRGKTLLVVNTASKCGFTPQYEGLEALWQELEPRGLQILGFPCNQFGHQEPGDSGQIDRFCRLNYGVSFAMFAKIQVNGRGTHPLYVQLKSAAPGLLGSRAVKWNFTKFLVDKEGTIRRRFSPRTAPAALRGELLRIL